MKFKKIIITLILLLAIAGVLGYLYIDEQEKELEALTKESVDSASVASSTSVVVQKYAMSEVIKHNRKSDCWMVVDKSVVDVTSFVEKHPGGDKILEGCGKDATKMFNKIKGHLGGVAQMILRKLTIGQLEN